MSRPASEDGPIVIALGGNALVRRGEQGTIAEQQAHAREALAPVADLIAAGTRVVVTHGNGPVVGNILERNEAARDRIAPMPLWVAGADSQGGIGSMLQLTLRGLLEARGCPSDVVTLVTHVIVSADDPAFSDPTKPIGPWYSEADARAMESAEGWRMREVPGRGWRRVVPSPAPVRLLEASSIGELAAAGHVVIAAGGGGIPVQEEADGTLTGCDAVVDKDASAALLARTLGASTLVILMEADAVRLDFGTPSSRPLPRLTADEAEHLLASGALEAGSMAPKLAAAASFARSGGRTLICSAEGMADALAGRAGTLVAG